MESKDYSDVSQNVTPSIKPQGITFWHFVIHSILGGPDREMYAIIEVLNSQAVSFIQPCQDWEKREILLEDVPEGFVNDPRTHIYVECFPSKIIMMEHDILIDHHNERSQERSSLIQVKILMGLEIDQQDLWIEGWDREGLYGAVNAGAPRDVVTKWVKEAYGQERVEKWKHLVNTFRQKNGVLIVRTKEQRLLGLGNIIDLQRFPERIPTLFIRDKAGSVVEYLYIGLPSVVHNLQHDFSGFIGGNPSSFMYWGVESPRWKIPTERNVVSIVIAKQPL